MIGILNVVAGRELTVMITNDEVRQTLKLVDNAFTFDQLSALIERRIEQQSNIVVEGSNWGRRGNLSKKLQEKLAKVANLKRLGNTAQDIGLNTLNTAAQVNPGGGGLASDFVRGVAATGIALYAVGSIVNRTVRALNASLKLSFDQMCEESAANNKTTLDLFKLLNQLGKEKGQNIPQSLYEKTSLMHELYSQIYDLNNSVSLNSQYENGMIVNNLKKEAKQGLNHQRNKSFDNIRLKCKRARDFGLDLLTLSATISLVWSFYLIESVIDKSQRLYKKILSLCCRRKAPDRTAQVNRDCDSLVTQRREEERAKFLANPTVQARAGTVVDNQESTTRTIAERLRSMQAVNPLNPEQVEKYNRSGEMARVPLHEGRSAPDARNGDRLHIAELMRSREQNSAGASK